MSAAQPDPEAEIRTTWERGDHDRAATLALELYGDEILGFLLGRLRDRADASEVFSMFAEDFWVGLPRFAWRCSMRGWAYAIARHATHRFVIAPHRRPERNLTLSQQTQVSAVRRARAHRHRGVQAHRNQESHA